MAFDARGWRKLVVGNEVYYRQPVERWNAAELFRVRMAREPNKLLRVQCGWCGRLVDVVGRVTPGLVRDAIDAARDFGWPGMRSHLCLLAFTVPEVPMLYRFVGPTASWVTPTTVALANGIYADRAFDRMPILADALEEAGCDNADVLSHCRGAGPHVRGCWVVDLLLGKS